MAECEPSSDVEGNMTAQGSGPLAEDKTSVAVDPEKKEFVGKNDKVEEKSMLNGSAPPEDKSEGNMKALGSVPLADNKTTVVVDPEKNETADKNEKVEETSMLNGSAPPEHKSDEPKSGEEGNKNENKEEEDVKDKKHAEVNSTAKENDIEESKEGNNIKDVSTSAKANDVEETKEDNNVEDKRTVGKEDDIEETKEDNLEDKRTVGKENEIEETKEDNNVEDASTTVKENDIEETKEDKKMEDVSTSKAEDVKMSDAEGGKTVEDVSCTAKVNDVEESKEDKTDDASTSKAVDEKMTDLEGDEAVDIQDTTMVDAEDVKDEEGGGEEGEEKGVEQGAKEGENDTEEQENETIEEKVDEDKEAKGFKRKRTPVQKTKSMGKDSAMKAKELLNRPMTSSIDRPVRERKTVERLVEVIEKEASREFQVEKGRGTPLKDIPHVAHKLAKKKPADIKLIHQTLFGRKGKAVNFKHHILQFSGFVWHESDEKQRAKMKEKLDKYVKDTLLDLCDLFDLPVVSKANTRKEDLVEKLLDFLVAPHPTNESKSRKRKRVAKGSESKDMEDIHSKRSKKKHSFSHNEEEKSGSEMDDEGEDDDFDNSGSFKGKVAKHSESEEGDNELEEVSEEDEHEKKDREKGKRDKKKAFKKQDSVGKEKVGTTSKLSPILATTKSPKTSSSKRSKAQDDDVGAKVFSRKKKIADSPKKSPTPRSAKKEKDTGKKTRQNKTKSEAEPNKEELRKKICEILKEVDFNTATFTDILKQLAAYYKLDLAPRKASIKLIIQEELTKLAEAEDDEDDEDEEDEENQEPAVKAVEV